MSLKCTIIPVTPFQQNSTLVWNDETMVGASIDPGGDIDQICQSAESECDTLRTFKSNLFAMHPTVIDLLVSRYNEGLASSPIV